MSISLKGITWSHSRGFTSIVAVSQRFSELHPDVIQKISEIQQL